MVVIMNQKYGVTLTDQEQEKLQALIKQRREPAVSVKRAYHVGLRTVERLRQRLVEEGVEKALEGKKREVFKDPVLDGKVEA